MAVASDFIIDSADISAVNVESQPTVLRGTSTQNKQVFDKYCDMIVSHFNGLCGMLDEGQSTVVDNSVLTLYASMGWVQD